MGTHYSLYPFKKSSFFQIELTVKQQQFPYNKTTMIEIAIAASSRTLFSQQICCLWGLPALLDSIPLMAPPTMRTFDENSVDPSSKPLHFKIWYGKRRLFEKKLPKVFTSREFLSCIEGLEPQFTIVQSFPLSKNSRDV